MDIIFVFKIKEMVEERMTNILLFKLSFQPGNTSLTFQWLLKGVCEAPWTMSRPATLSNRDPSCRTSRFTSVGGHGTAVL